MSDTQTPAGWYEDPAKIGELRYYDGAQWTEHVTIGGVQTTAPLDGGTASADAAAQPTFTMRRDAQWRSEEEKPVEVVGRNGVLGRFVPMLDGAAGYRFQDVEGGVIIIVSKPSFKSTVEVQDASGSVLGTITKVGRLHSRYDIAATAGTQATVRLTGGASDAWELQIGGATAATFTRQTESAADALNFAGTEYTATMVGALDGDMERMFLGVPLAIDILDTQTVS